MIPAVSFTLGTFLGVICGWLIWGAARPPAPLPIAKASYLTGPWR